MNRELEEALRELALEIAQAYAVIEQQKAVMRQALEALESLFNWQVDPERGQRCAETITALREALED